jgi:hypothetical protein
MSPKFRLVTVRFHTYADIRTLDFARAHAIVDAGRDS